MLDAHPSSATNMLYDLELFLSLLTSTLLFILATPVRNLMLSPDTLFDKSYYHSLHFLHGMITSSDLAHSCMANLPKTCLHHAKVHSLLVVAGSWKGSCALPWQQRFLTLRWPAGRCRRRYLRV